MELLPFTMVGKPPYRRETCWEAELRLSTLQFNGPTSKEDVLEEAAIKPSVFSAGSATSRQ